MARPLPRRLASPLRISQSSLPPSRFGTAAGLKRAWFRTETSGKTTSISSRSSAETGGRITSAWLAGLGHVLIDRRPSTRDPRTPASSRRPPGAERTGLPAWTSIPRTCPSPGVSDLVGQAGDRDLAVHLGQAADPLRPASESRRTAERPTKRRARVRSRNGSGNIAPPGAIEVAGNGVQDVDQPVDQRPGALLADADAAVGDCRRRGGEVAGELGDLRGVDPASGAARSGGQSATSARDARRRRSQIDGTSSSPSAKITCSIPSSRNASPPGAPRRAGRRAWRSRSAAGR